jgi:predicted RNA-binding protein with PIN domain
LDIRLTRDRAEKNYSIHQTKKKYKTTELETIARFALFYWLGTFGDFKKKNFIIFLEATQKYTTNKKQKTFYHTVNFVKKINRTEKKKGIEKFLSTNR